jgi:UDP-N-acetylglucosamine diphosphorylase / glucose-1-phosphate thymidylyltransferase / UDP-N-acetylgalactosamine diphosphorylase / glucosamine-1-phosphate N-acetyltransferase / galactosamine-1-phosphate N-acetyltransferase
MDVMSNYGKICPKLTNKIMQVILLAAGQSTRLDPIEDKNLLEFSGKTLIEHRVAAIKNAKLRDIVVVGGKHNMDALKKAVKKYNNVVVVEQENLADGMAGGVLAGADIVKQKNIMVISANDVFDDDLFEKALQAAKTAEDGLVVGKRSDKYFPGGYLKIDKKNYITDIIEKPGEGKEPSNMINIVFHVYNDFPAFVSFLEKTKGKADDRYERALDTYIKKGKAKMTAFKYNGYWQPIKYPWHILRLMEHFFEAVQPKIDKTAKISKTAVINGNVYIGANVKVMENAVIQGPAYIGDGSIIANNSLVRGSMIGKNCVVGFTTEVARSYLNHDVWMHTNYVGDSIVDSNVSFGAGTVLGNLRFDEENIKVNIKDEKTDTGTNKFGAIIGRGTRFGINSTTNPGVKIGKNVFVGGNVHVEKDIPDNKIVILSQKLEVMENKKSADVKERK